MPTPVHPAPHAGATSLEEPLARVTLPADAAVARSEHDAAPHSTSSAVAAGAATWVAVAEGVTPGPLIEGLVHGTVCYVHGGGAVALLGGSGVLVYVEGDDPKHAAEDTHGRASGMWIVLSVDDPSPWLGWILRRLEEGHRVLVDTHARAPEGAHRGLLGLAAGVRADAWLAAHHECAVVEAGDAWRLHRRVMLGQGGAQA
jgi:hypothetical protein